VEQPKWQARYIIVLPALLAASVHAPPEGLNLRSLLDNIVAKDETKFSHGAGLVWVCTVETKGVTWREIACTNIGQVSANEETAPLIGRRDRERCRGTAWAVQQIDESVCGTPRARDISPANREREAVFEGVTRQHRPAGRRCTL